MPAESLLSHVNVVWKAQTTTGDSHISAGTDGPMGGFDTLISMFFMLSGIHIGCFRVLFDTVVATCSSVGADVTWALLTWALEYLDTKKRTMRVRNPATYLAVLLQRCCPSELATPPSPVSYTIEDLLCFK